MMINTTINAVLQVLVLLLIPFIAYLIRKKTTKGFWNDLGFKKSNKKANLYALLVMLILVLPVIILVLTNDEFKEIMLDSKSVSGAMRKIGFGIEAVVVILLSAIIKTALSEEIFFRGFLAKRLIAITSFRTGNLIQAIIFGAIHALVFILITSNLLFLTVIFIFPTIGAYFKTYLNEKMANGSIIPGWIAHATANIISYSFVAFCI